MGKFEFKTRLTAVRKLVDQVSMVPRGVLDQSFVRTNLPISPPPTKKLALDKVSVCLCGMFIRV